MRGTERLEEGLSQNGVYVYGAGRWVLSEKIPLDADGFYVVYFSNTMCGACRKFNETWFKLTKELSGATFVVVLCDWFARSCRSETAKRLFEIFDVHVSPTLVFLVRENGKITRMYKHEGTITAEGFLAVFEAFKRVLGEK